MVALESLKSNDGNTGELGNNHDMDPPNMQNLTARILVIDVHVNQNSVPLKPVDDLPH